MYIVPDKNENHFEDFVTVSQKLHKKGRQGVTPVTLALKKLRHKDRKFKDSLSSRPPPQVLRL